MESRIRLMTHNVWNKDFNSPEWEQKGENCSAAARVGGLLRVYRETAPTSLAVRRSPRAWRIF